MVSAASAGRSACVTPQPAAKAAEIDSTAVSLFMMKPPEKVVLAGQGLSEPANQR
jgi:hypothetical protein